jgi:hypothetical protein
METYRLCNLFEPGSKLERFVPFSGWARRRSVEDFLGKSIPNLTQLSLQEVDLKAAQEEVTASTKNKLYGIYTGLLMTATGVGLMSWAIYVYNR